MSRIQKSIAKWVGAFLLLFCSFSYSNAQTQTTPNVISTTVAPGLPGVQQSWSGFVPSTSTGGGLSGGHIPEYNPSTGQFMFGYSQGTFAYSMAINSALSGSGVQVGGIEYGLTYFNQDFSRGTLGVTAQIYSNTNSLLQSYNHNLPHTTNGWTPWSQAQTFASPYSLATLGNATLSMTGQDDRFWAGLYGPQFKDPYLRFTYTVDPCMANPRYSPSCPGYSVDNWYTGNLTSVHGTTFAINQALGFGNTGVRVHSVNWGYDYNIGGQYCSGFNLLGICFAWSDSYVGAGIAITDNNANTILTDSNHTSGQNIIGSFRKEVLLGGSSRDIATLGAASISTYTGGIASITPYIGFNFTPDICNTDPLVNPSCPGYAAAYFTQQCTANPLFDPNCPGYAAAYFTQQCTANPLYNPSCPGYAAAYLTAQCNANPLYSPSCPGYAVAYKNQQCSINPLYATDCSGYATASAQCAANPLTAAYCPGYNTAMTQCEANGLAHTYCPTYQSELTYCSTDPLFNNLCPTYQTATAQCLVNPLTGSYCPSYQTATASCATNSLNHSYCPNYQTALNTCSTNPLSNSLCSGYTAATNTCNANQLTYTYCPSYNTAIAACSTNPQGNTMCPGYSATASSGGGSSPATSTTVSTSAPSVQVAKDGKVTTEVPLVADSNVNTVITEKATSTAPSPTAAVSLTPPPATQSPAAPATVAKTEPKKEEPKSEAKKEETKTAESSASTSNASSSSEQKKDQPKTARQEIQERRVEAARAKAIEDGKQLANKMGEAATMEAQVAVQNVVIQAMGFTPGFDSYGKVMLPDARGYRPFEIYPGQRVIDNPASRRFMTGSDRLHTEMVDSQYNREK